MSPRKNGDAPLHARAGSMRGADREDRRPSSGVTPLMAAAGLDYWEGESPGPFTGVTEPERLEAVKLALASWATTSTRTPISAIIR